jgi:hypothetical protein
MAAKYRIWPDAIAALATRNPPTLTFTAADVAAARGDDNVVGAANLLKRLRDWGYIRLVGFEPPRGGRAAGRRRHVYELTEKGMRRGQSEAAAREERERSEQKS